MGSDPVNWLEISLTVGGELAEAISDVLARFAPNGVVTEQGVRYRDEEDEGIGEGPITICAYLPMDAELEERRRRIEDALGHLNMIQPLPAPAFKVIPDQNWMEAWKQHYRPIPVGQRLVIVPAWLDYQSSDRIAVKIDPGMAFGTGTHPTTQLCLELVEKVLDSSQPKVKAGVSQVGRNVIDVGCGSGILSIAALKLGAASALAVDIDSQAIDNARQNARINRIGSELSFGIGSVQEIREGKFPIRSADLVLVNILAPVIIRLFEQGLTTLKSPGGFIILSGILESQAGQVIAAAKRRGLDLREKLQMEDWIALLMEA